MSEPLVVIGNGMAAARFVDELSTRALGRYAVAVIGAEPRLAYNRVLLSSVLAGEVASSDIELKPRAGGATAASRCATAAARPRSTATDAQRHARRRRRRCLLEARVRDRLEPIRPAIPGMDLPGVITFRDLDDVDHPQAPPVRRASAVVIGGGLLGLEAAYGLAKARRERHASLHLMDRLMERQLDRTPPPHAAGARSRRKGIEVISTPTPPRSTATAASKA